MLGSCTSRASRTSFTLTSPAPKSLAQGSSVRQISSYFLNLRPGWMHVILTRMPRGRITRNKKLSSESGGVGELPIWPETVQGRRLVSMLQRHVEKLREEPAHGN